MKRASGALGVLVLVLLASACGKGGDRDEARPRSDSARPDTAGAGAGAAMATDSAPPDSAPTLGRSRLAGPDLIDIHYRLLGTEPFWAIDMTRDGLAYTRLGEDSVSFPFRQLRRRPRVDVMRSSADGHEIEAEVRRERCSDGMSDRVYPFSARVVIDGEELRGCAFEPPVEAPTVAESTIRRAGLSELVREARRTRAGKTDLRRVVGTLQDSASPGAKISFAGYFAGDTLRLIETRTTRDGRTLSEASYFFDGGARARSPRLRLVDADTWSAAGVHAWAVLGFGSEGAPAGALHEVDGVSAAVPAGFAREWREVSARLVEATLRSAARGLP